ncbi:uncharacterized protein BXZ73DRAFT_106142 [Epithele typhae]|uniref:uncharacterized protein n=1 Tax=Epithele typhae TaxID=378194 RepID=UPI0020086369|nr:uncharacterized protein BXZ73DRAFT_106142 [Epithele typhae]KAH9915591.1 hypothetical protein BXZ73DRAFT_106142 [Epithele typhae]
MLPVNCLPRELLIKIFALIPNLPSVLWPCSVEPFDWRTDLMLVCREWRDLVAGTPKFWSLLYVQPSTPIEHLSCWISHCADAPLDVYLGGRFGPRNPWEVPLMPLVVAQSHRIRKIVIPNTSGPVVEILFQRTSWSLLTHMHLDVPGGVDGPRISGTEFIFDLPQCFPKLSHLSLAGSLPFVNPQLLRTIKSLKVAPATLYRSPWTSTLGKFFASHVQEPFLRLTSLTIRAPSDHLEKAVNGIMDAPLFGGGLKLPCLTYLKIFSSCPLKLAPLIRQVLSSKRIKVYVVVPRWQDLFPPIQPQARPRSLLDALLGDESVMGPPPLSLSPLHSTKVCLEQTGVAFYGRRCPSTNEPTFTLRVSAHDQLEPHYSLTDALHDAPRLFCGTAPDHLYVFSTHTKQAATVASWRALFRGLRGLKELRVHAHIDVSPLFDALRPGAPPVGAATGGAGALGDGAEDSEERLGANLGKVTVGDAKDVVLSIQGGEVLHPLVSKELLAAVVDCFGARRREGMSQLAQLKMHLAWPVERSDEPGAGKGLEEGRRGEAGAREDENMLALVDQCAARLEKGLVRDFSHYSVLH